MNRAELVDIAVVGGGISGLYCFLQLDLAMRTKKPLKCLNNRHPSSIGIYESTNRFGGRIETWSFNYSDPKTPPTQANETFHAEFGPMRIEPTHQPLLKDLLDYLGIKESDDPKDHRGLVKFPAYSADDPEEPRFKLEGEEAEQKSLLDLLLLAVRRICELVVEEPADLDRWSKNNTNAAKYLRQFTSGSSIRRRYWKGELRDWIMSLDDRDYDFIRQKIKINDVYLHDMGFWNLLSEVLSHLAVIRIRDWCSYYHMIGENPNAAEHLVFVLRTLKTTNSLRGVRGGMQQIVRDIEERIESDIKTLGSEKVIVGKDHRLTTLRQTENTVELTFSNGHTAHARHVILALPQRPLQNLTFLPSNPVKDEIDSVMRVGLLKVFFVIDQPWWENDRPQNKFSNDIPAREIYYWKSEDKMKGVLMVYTDQPALQFWTDYLKVRQKPGAAQTLYDIWTDKHENERLWRRFVQYARDYGHNDFIEDQLLACGIRDWSREPYGAALHLWEPRRKSWEIYEKLTAFSLADARRNNIHICGDSYSDYQGFIEGALRSAARVLHYLKSEERSSRHSTNHSNLRRFLDVDGFRKSWALNAETRSQGLNSRTKGRRRA